MKPKLLDLFCGAGGASMGYYRAGFAPYGIDNKPQPHYPFPFLCMDALEAMDRLFKGEGLTFSGGETLYLPDFVAFHASPPCQFAINQYRGRKVNLIPAIRERLLKTGKLYIIENIPRARKHLQSPFYLCGTWFELKVKRHRYFETNFQIISLFPPCACKKRDGFTNSHRGISSFTKGAKLISVVAQNFSVPDAKLAMGIDWMIGRELSQAIPPAYTEYIGKYLLKAMDKLERAMMRHFFRDRKQRQTLNPERECVACGKPKTPPYYVGLGYWECPFCGHINKHSIVGEYCSACNGY